MSEYMYVVTCPELGWDCVVGVFTTEERAKEFASQFTDTVIHHVELNKALY